MAYKRIIYCSRYIEENKIENIFSFLKKARIYNESVGISGYLIFCNGLFLQIMEGFAGPLEDLMSKIEKDKRHDNIVFLDSKKIDTLSFDNWNMGFTDISRDDQSFELKKKLFSISKQEVFDPSTLSGEQAFEMLKVASQNMK